MGMQVTSARREDSLVASMNALRRFEHEREDRIRAVDDAEVRRQVEWEAEQERWVAEVRKLASEEAQIMEAERRRFEAEVLAAAAVKAAAPRSALRSLALVTVLLLAGGAGYVHLESRAALAERETEVQAALRGERAEAARGATAAARIARLEKDRAQLVEENARLAARLQDVAPAAWNADLPLGPTLLVLPAQKAVIEAPAPAPVAPPEPAVTPLALPEPVAPVAVAKAEPAPVEKKSSRRHGERSARADRSASKPVKPVDIKFCPPDKPICR